jgi:hypothetical protein
MTDAHHRWVAELTPTAGTAVDQILELPVGLDIWERRGDKLVVAADAAQLQEIERRLLATVVWLGPVEEFSRQQGPAEEPETKGEGT